MGEVAANRIRLTSFVEEAADAQKLRAQLGDLEEQNLELSQFVQQLKDELKRVQISSQDEEMGSVGIAEQISILDETNELHVPQNIQLKNENQRLRTLNAALQEQQGKERSRVGDFEREMHRLKTENRRLKDENLTAKKNLLDMETFAKESVDGGN